MVKNILLFDAQPKKEQLNLELLAKKFDETEIKNYARYLNDEIGVQRCFLSEGGSLGERDFKLMKNDEFNIFVSTPTYIQNLWDTDYNFQNRIWITLCPSVNNILGSRESSTFEDDFKSRKIQRDGIMEIN